MLLDDYWERMNLKVPIYFSAGYWPLRPAFHFFRMLFLFHLYIEKLKLYVRPYIASAMQHKRIKILQCYHMFLDLFELALVFVFVQ